MDQAQARELRTREAATLDDLARLRAFVGTHTESAGILERHLAAPRYRPALTRLAERGGVLAACALLSHQRLQLGAATIDTGTIDLFAAPHEQADMAALVGDCLGTLMEQGLPLATLRGDAATFAPFGFAPFRFAAETRLPTESVPMRALRPVAEDDLDDLAALYAASYREQPLAEVRAAPDWRAWLTAGHSALVLEDSRSRLTAYARITRGASTLTIDEAAAADAGAAQALIGGLRQYALASGQPIVLTLAPSHLVAQAALHERADMRIRAANDGAGAPLAGIVDLPGMLEALVPVFEQRLAGSRYAGWNGALRVEIETERVVLSFRDGRAEVIDGSRPADVGLRRIALTALAQLCLGYRAAADLRAAGGLDCDDAALGLIDALFPVVMPFGR
jgi:hypothetical protein